MSICIWPDGAWCKFGELGEFSHRSDDFIVRDVPDDVEDTDAWAAQQVNA